MDGNRFQFVKRVFSSDRYGIYMQQFPVEKVKNKGDRKKIELLMDRSRRIRKHVRYYTYVRVFFFILLYASVALPFLSDIPFLKQYGQVVVNVASLLGASVISVILLALTKLIATHVGDLDVLTAHMVALYAKNDVFPDVKHPKLP